MMFRKLIQGALLAIPCLSLATAAPTWDVGPQVSSGADSFVLADGAKVAAIAVDEKDYPVVQIAANLLADDIQRVTGSRPEVNGATPKAPLVIAGTLGHSKFIDQLVTSGKLKGIDQVKGHWETTSWQIVEKPFPDVERALVIVGSDRRGTAYGLTQFSEKIGVSPWAWWADVPVKSEKTLVVKFSGPQIDAPSVKYRGIFINDEDWALQPWAAKTFDPEFKNIGPKTYAKIYELMLRLRLNYIWPAMHECSTEFSSLPENAEVADRYAIVAGASHCEPMLYNNVHWDPKKLGEWDYSQNRDAIHSIWEKSAKERGGKEAVWTVGIRGIHDGAMKGPKEQSKRIELLDQVIQEQRKLLDANVSKEWGEVAQCFVPYKEVLPLYDAGLKVPDDVTLVWVDDNLGYIRRLSSLEERKRSGGSGVYYHLSYWGNPSYTLVNSTPPALLWLELHKAWENEAKNIWVLNVGDIKPMEMGVDFYARLAWNPDGYGADCQPAVITEFVRENLGENLAKPGAELLRKFYQLGVFRRPESMSRAWALSLTEVQVASLKNDYETLLKDESALAKLVSEEARPAYSQMIGYSTKIMGASGLIFLADREIQQGKNVAANEAEVKRLRGLLDASAKECNEMIGGKWNLMYQTPDAGIHEIRWNAVMQWPWYETGKAPSKPVTGLQPTMLPVAGEARDAAAADRFVSQEKVKWAVTPGLGVSSRAVSLQPADVTLSWKTAAELAKAPRMEFDFESKAGDAEISIDFLPTFRLVPGMKLRVAVSVDNAAAIFVEVPCSDGKEDEKGPARQNAIINNTARAKVPLSGLTAGKHTLKISAVDPGAVVDRVYLPTAR